MKKNRIKKKNRSNGLWFLAETGHGFGTILASWSTKKEITNHRSRGMISSLKFALGGPLLARKGSLSRDGLCDTSFHNSPRSALRYARTNASAGITLLEAAVWVSILTIVLLALNTSLLYFYRTNRYSIEQSSAVTSAQHGMDKVIRTIREATYSSQGAFPIVAIGPNDFTFYADVDSDPLIEKVRYYVSGTNLIQGITDATGDPPGYTTSENTSTVSDSVRNIAQNVTTFRYYDATGAEIIDYSKWANVRFVNASIIVNVDANKLPNQLTMSSSAALRNLK